MSHILPQLVSLGITYLLLPGATRIACGRNSRRLTLRNLDHFVKLGHQVKVEVEECVIEWKRVSSSPESSADGGVNLQAMPSHAEGRRRYYTI